MAALGADPRCTCTTGRRCGHCLDKKRPAREAEYLLRLGLATRSELPAIVNAHDDGKEMP